MTANPRHRLVAFCDVLAPLAFLAAAASMCLPFATVHFADEPAVRLTGLHLIYATAQSVSAGHADLVQKLLSNWRPTIFAAGVFALAGVVGVFVRFFGSARHQSRFEKIELFIGALGAICMGALASGAADLEIRKQGLLVYEQGMTSVAICFGVALLASAVAFALEIPPGGDFRVGALRYNNRTLAQVFFWVLWGDFFFVLFEAVLPQILPLQLRAIGCDPRVMALLILTIPNIVNTAVVPVVSFKSDRTRTRWGRRIPYMVATAPFVVLFLISLGYLRRISDWTAAHAAWFGSHDPAALALVFVGVLIVGFYFFNDFVGSLYYYLFADVVPHETMGRFVGLSRVVGAFAGFLFNTFLYKHALTHTEAIYTVAGVAYLVGFTLMCVKVKEGAYPDVVDDGRKPTFFGNVKTYFRECFSDPLIVAYFVFNAVWAVSNACNMYKVFFFTETVGITLTQIGMVSGWIGLIALLLMYPTGMLVDRFKPLPTLLVTTIFLIPAVFAGYFVHDLTTYIIVGLIGMPLNAVWDATSMPATVQLMPKDKFGQFCSANATLRNLVRTFLPLVGGWYIASMAVDVVKVAPGESIRVWCEGMQWKTEAAGEVARDPLAAMAAAPGVAPDFRPATNLVTTLALKRRLDLKSEKINCYLLAPDGRDREVVLPGAMDKRWFYLANTAPAGGTIRLKLPQWRYVWFWQCGFMAVGLVSIVVVFTLWRRREREKAAAAGT